MFAVQQVIEYYSSRGSTVYVASLDASQASDRVEHVTLIAKLKERMVPACFINIVNNW